MTVTQDVLHIPPQSTNLAGDAELMANAHLRRAGIAAITPTHNGAIRVSVDAAQVAEDVLVAVINAFAEQDIHLTTEALARFYVARKAWECGHSGEIDANYEQAFFFMESLVGPLAARAHVNLLAPDVLAVSARLYAASKISHDGGQS